MSKVRLSSDWPTEMSNDMESDRVTIDCCDAGAKGASRFLRNPARVGNPLIPRCSEESGSTTGSTIKGSDAHKSLNNSVPSVGLDVDLGGTAYGSSIPKADNISTGSEFFSAGLRPGACLRQGPRGGPVAA